MMRKKSLAASFCVSLLLASFAHAQVLLDVETRPGFDENYKLGGWMPFTVIIDNRGPGIEGVLQVRLDAPHETPLVFSKPVSLPKSSRKKETLYILLKEWRQDFVLRLVSGGREIWSRKVDLRPLRVEDYLVLHIARARAGLGFMSGLKSPYGGKGKVSLVNGRIREFPDRWRGLGGVDLIVLGNVSPREFTIAQRKALTEWVMSGGNLVVTGGPAVTELKGSFLEELLPVSIKGTISLPSLDALATFSGRGFPSQQPTLVAHSVLESGEVLLEQGGVPIIAQRKFGSGTVVFMAFDPARPPLRGWEGNESIWNQRLRRVGIRRLDPESDARTAQAIHEIRATEPPSLRLVGFFLLAYFICLGPANYFVLKKLGRKELSWVTMPVIVIVFSMGAYFAGHRMKGGVILTNEVSLVEAYGEADTALAETYMGIFSPRKTYYDIGFAGGSSFPSEPSAEGARGKALHFWEGEDMGLKEVGFNKWSMRVFRVDSVLPVRPSAAVTASEGVLEGAVVSGSAFDFDESYLFWKGKLLKDLGPLGAGVRISFRYALSEAKDDVPVAALPLGDYGDRQTKLVRNLLSRWVVGRGRQEGLLMVGIADSPALNLDLGWRRPKRQAISVYLLHIPVQEGKGDAASPPG